MAYAIIRTRKLTTNGQMGGMQKHNDRKGKTWSVENADKDLTWKNVNQFKYGSSIVESIEKNIEKKEVKSIRSNSVKCIEVLMTFSPDFIKFKKTDKPNKDGKYDILYGKGDQEKWNKFNEKAFDFLKDKFGEGNLTSFSVHLDEKTPHIHAYLTPIVKKTVKWKNANDSGEKTVNKLCARDFLGGYDKMQTLQDEFAKYMEPLGLERGVRGSTAKHEKVKSYYGRVEKAKSVEKKVEDYTPQSEYFELTPPPKNPWKREDYVRDEEERVNEAIKQAFEAGANQVKEQFSKEYHRVTEGTKIQNDLHKKVGIAEGAYLNLVEEKSNENATNALEKQDLEREIKTLKHDLDNSLIHGMTLIRNEKGSEEWMKSANVIESHFKKPSINKPKQRGQSM